MKKQLLTAAVSAAIALPMLAQAGIYGRTDGVIRYTDSDTAANETWDVGVDKMRWGIVGSEDLGNGMKALYHYEWALNNDGLGGANDSEAERLAYVGLEGGFGKLTIGRNWFPSYFSVWNKTDTADGHPSVGSESNLSGNRSGNMIAYSSPNFSGFKVDVAMIVANESGATQEDGVDLWEISGSYKNGPLQIGATFRNDQRGNGASAASNTTFDLVGTGGATTFSILGASSAATNNDVDVWGIGASYTFGDLTVEGVYGNSDPGAGADTDVYAIGATYTMGPNQIHGAFSNNEVDNGGQEKDDWYIGFRHFMSKETRLFVEYRQSEVTPAGGGASVDTDVFALGMRKDWKL
jgi:predicted porin